MKELNDNDIRELDKIFMNNLPCEDKYLDLALKLNLVGYLDLYRDKESL
jgi:hypothetical protein